MSLHPIDPYDDPRVTHEFAVLNGRRYHYVQGLPRESPPMATILCLHGFPDIWYGWRFIIPHLLQRGFRVIVPDLLGFGQTDAPRVPPATLSAYSWKAVANDMYQLVKDNLNVPKVILLGHDWGGVIASRIYMYHPSIVSHIISVCTPFPPPMREYMPIREFVEKRMPNFKYQIGLQNPQTEKDLESTDNIRRFLNWIQRGRKDEPGGDFMITENLLGALGNPARASFMTEKDLEYLVEQFSRNGMHGPLNWYRTRKINHQDEKDMTPITVTIPFLFIGAKYDLALPPRIAIAQAAWAPKLTSRQLDTAHWVLTEDPLGVVSLLNEWFDAEVFGGGPKI